MSARQNTTPECNTGTPVNLLNHLQLLPLNIMAWMDGRKLLPILAEVTGLSPSHLRDSKPSRLRASTEKTVAENSRKHFHKRAAENGWSREDIERYINEVPSTLAGESLPFADLIYSVQYFGAWKLPLTIAYAAEYDRLINQMLIAQNKNDLEFFKRTLLESKWWNAPQEYVAILQCRESFISDLNAANDWGTALQISNKYFLDNLLMCLIAALDAEFGAIYFPGQRPHPLFTFVTPKLNPQFNPDSGSEIPRRNLVIFPARRLLEFSYAVMVWIKRKQWPKGPVGRKRLGEVLDLTDQHVGNLFDGTRKMTLRLFDQQWGRLCKKVAYRDPLPAPTPLLLAVSLFQNGFIRRYDNQKLKSVVIFDEVIYRDYWKWHRGRWASQLPKGDADWPDWLGAH